MENASALVAELEQTFAGRSLEDWTGRLDAAGLIWAPVRSVEEAIRDPQARAMGYFYELEHAEAGRFETVAPPFRIEGTRLGARRAAPRVGADGEAVLREAGLELGPGDLARLSGVPDEDEGA